MTRPVPPGSMSRRESLLGWIATGVAQRSRRVVGVWAVVVLALGVVGLNLEGKLANHAIVAGSSGTARAHEISVREFGADYPIVVMLQGPPAAVRAQGIQLARKLAAKPRTEVVSPWVDGPTVEGLRPRPGVQAMLVRVAGAEADQISGLLPPVRDEVDATVRPPVRASMAGLPLMIDSLHRASAKTSLIGELIAVPVLLLVLLFVFRSVLAAVTPLLVGGAVVAATRGVLMLMHGLVRFDLMAATVVGMLGLALGVDYALLVVSRYREERKSHDRAGAAEATVRAAARSILPAGCALLLAMFFARLILTDDATRSATTAIGLATIFSMLSAICVVPALLVVLDSRLERWSLPSRSASQIARLRLSRGLTRRPGAVLAMVLLLVVLSGLAFNLETGVGSVAVLPSGDPGRLQQEEVERGLGPGWAAPMEVVVDGRGRPVTTARRLDDIAAFQRRVEDDPGVASMAGLSKVALAARRLSGIEGELAAQERGLDRLEGGIAKLTGGADRNTSGLAKAASGSGQLTAGLGAAGEGAGALAGGLQKTSTGTARLTAGLSRANYGSGKLADGTTQASDGAGRLAKGVSEADEKTGEIVNSARLFENAARSGKANLAGLHDPLRDSEAQLADALRSLQRMTSGRGDPEYAAVVAAVEEASRRLSGNDPATGEQLDPSYAGVEAGIGQAEGEFDVSRYLAGQLRENGHEATRGMAKLSRGSQRLDHGLGRLAEASQQVSEGVAALTRGGQLLSPALRKLSSGAERLSGGIDLLENGSGQLSSGLSTGAEKSRLLPQGLRRISAGLGKQRGQNGESGLQQLQRRSPGLFHSAYFVLASLDGSRARQRAQVGSLLNVDRDGSVARLLVIPRDEATTSAARQTATRLQADAANLARQTGADVSVGGLATADIELNDHLRTQAPLVRLALSLVSLIVLIPLLRSLFVPLLAALINLIAVSASFGILSLLFNGSLLGGPGYVETLVIPISVIVMFALAIDYEVFVFARMREEYVRTGSSEAAISRGLDRTAHVVTGAAIIMMSVFLAFATSELISVRVLGVSMAIGVFIDAFIVRLIIVPAMMSRMGKWAWWLPGWLDRLLPGG